MQQQGIRMAVLRSEIRKVELQRLESHMAELQQGIRMVVHLAIRTGQQLAMPGLRKRMRWMQAIRSYLRRKNRSLRTAGCKRKTMVIRKLYFRKKEMQIEENKLNCKHFRNSKVLVLVV